MAAPEDVTVLGAGIAGATVARAFADRGARVTVVDPDGVASGASGINAAVVRPRLWLASKSRVPDAEIVLHAFRHTTRWLQQHAGKRYRACGVMICATSGDDEQRLRDRASNAATADLAEFCDATRASELAGVELPHGGVWIETAGLCDLAGLARDQLEHSNITVQAQQPQHAADLTVLATGAERTLPSQPVRGQAIAVRWPGDAPRPRTVLCTSGYLAPPDDDGCTWIGSTYDRDDERCDERAADDDRIRERFDALPPIADALRRADVVQRFAAVRHTTRDRLPRIGAIDAQTWASLGHGSRGAITAPWAAHLLAAHAFADPFDVHASLRTRLDPSR